MARSDPDTQDPTAELLDRLVQMASGDHPPSFRELAAAAGLDPQSDFIGASLRDLDFRDENLSGFNFSEADLKGADFRRAKVAGLHFDHADVTGAIGLPNPQRPGGIVRVFEIVNRRGLDARPAAKFVQTIEKFDAEATVSRRDETVGGTSIMGLMMLGAGFGNQLIVEATGPQATEMLDALEELVAGRFGEDD